MGGRRHERSRKYLRTAENCIELAERATIPPAQVRYRWMADASLALAKEQKWLDGEAPPLAGLAGVRKPTR
ncbi:hypothetical protein EAS54_26175 [Bradyrhizobium guangzhouense]|nr:hypothetical protein [Bradyrhizobium guangzhouense]RXH12553.1 hypothetical protein EAS54_26175 [Bradyrhizobium guangzhouense]